MTDFWRDKVTVYISVPAKGTKPRSFARRIIGKCQIQGGFTDNTDNTVRNVVNSKIVITKDVARYIPPESFYSTADDLLNDAYTVQVGDFVVFGEAEDTVETATDFAELQQKYQNNGFKVTAVNAAINGMAVDNVMMSNT